MSSKSFYDFYNDDNNVSPLERAKIEFGVELIGKRIKVCEPQGVIQEQLAETASLKHSVVARLERIKVAL